jgi:hypothetical protein
MKTSKGLHIVLGIMVHVSTSTLIAVWGALTTGVGLTGGVAMTGRAGTVMTTGSRCEALWELVVG